MIAGDVLEKWNEGDIAGAVRDLGGWIDEVRGVIKK